MRNTVLHDCVVEEKRKGSSKRIIGKKLLFYFFDCLEIEERKRKRIILFPIKSLYTPLLPDWEENERSEYKMFKF